MHIKHFLLLIGILLSQLEATAQDEEALLKDFGQRLYGYLSDTDSNAVIDFILEDHYHELVDEQPWSANEKELAKGRFSQYYSGIFDDFTQSRMRLNSQYAAAREDGATFKYLLSYWEEHSKLEGAYRLTTVFLYEYDGLQNRVKVSVAVTIIDDMAIAVAIGPLKEDF